jgi:hypothetical protein
MNAANEQRGEPERAPRMFRKSREYARIWHVFATLQPRVLSAQGLSWLGGLPEPSRVWASAKRAHAPLPFQGTRTIVSVKNWLEADLSLHAVPPIK